jgi:hypothetical protein
MVVNFPYSLSCSDNISTFVCKRERLLLNRCGAAKLVILETMDDGFMQVELVPFGSVKICDKVAHFSQSAR